MSRLCFATGCRFCSLCSQQGLLWRNLITVFFTVNNPGEKISHGASPRRCHHPRCKHRQRHATTRRTHRIDMHRAAHAKRKVLKRSTFVFSARARRMCNTWLARARASARTPPHTAPKRTRKLFTCPIAFCHRICTNAQTFRPSRPFGSHRPDAPRAPGTTSATVPDARATPPKGALVSNADVDPTVPHEYLPDHPLRAPHRLFITYT